MNPYPTKAWITLVIFTLTMQQTILPRTPHTQSGRTAYALVDYDYNAQGKRLTNKDIVARIEQRANEIVGNVTPPTDDETEALKRALAGEKIFVPKTQQAPSTTTTASKGPSNALIGAAAIAALLLVGNETHRRITKQKESVLYSAAKKVAQALFGPATTTARQDEENTDTNDESIN